MQSTAHLSFPVSDAADQYVGTFSEEVLSMYAILIVLLAPTGALTVTVVYYIDPQPLFVILSISANIFSFSF